jgi:glycosyltransferase involved in cell wall biosynthesis
MTSSLILATYNGERLVLDQLVSLRDQTKQFDEVLIFDDASTDNTVKVIKAFIIANRLESTWHILINPNNLGYETNFFDLLKTASSDLIF